MADQEHGFESPEGHRLCVNNCGFLGSPSTQDMCSKCYRDLTAAAVEPTRPTATSSASLMQARPLKEEPLRSPDGARADEPAPATGRCAACRKRTGLTGFRCRCGTTFCGAHRYPERHGCAYDYKAAGREAIARENPAVRGEKLSYKI